MASQEWTLFTLAGSALPDLNRLLTRWSDTRRGNDDSGCPQWPKRTRASAARIMHELALQNSMPPVVYFSTHVDLWSSYGALFRFIPQGPPVVAYEDREVWAYNLPDRSRLVRRARRIRSVHEFPESVWLANVLEAAATAYAKLWRYRILLIQRRAWTTSPTDKDLVAAASKRPRWISAAR